MKSRKIPMYLLPPILLLMTGCETLEQPITEYYDGDTATVTDTMFNQTDSRADFCVMEAIDGKNIRNSISDTKVRTQGQGFRLLPFVTDRAVKVQSMRVTLSCDTYYAAPISALKHKAYPVKGIVSFVPKNNMRYLVKGEMNLAQSKVWIVEEESGIVVTDIVTKLGK
jgi:hypothetical protein